jgi:hypothetical protein
MADAEQFFLKQTMYEGESRNYDVGGYVYTIKLLGVFDTQLKAQFEVNGETTKALGEDESDKLSDDAVIQVREVLPQESGDGRDIVQFNFFPASHAGTVPGQTVTQTSEPVQQPAATQKQENIVTSQPTQTSSASETQPTKRATVDVTRKAPAKSAWGRFFDWIKNLFG